MIYIFNAQPIHTMHRIFLFITACLFLTAAAQAQQYKINGRVTNSLGSHLSAASVSLLNPADSTFINFAISNEEGRYVINHVKDGDYLLQVALMGYYTFYDSVTIGHHHPTDLGVHILEEHVHEIEGMVMEETIITGERIPVSVKGDTLEYNAASFKVSPDAVVEDLLRKMPGMEVDKDGNVNSMGQQVGKVLVDGKEFFGHDPKVALKNLPADAVDKIQSFSRRPESALFSGVDDGQREQALNIVLKEDRHAGYFGEARGGGGTEHGFDASLKAFRFRKESQLATIGMLNNINKFGFSISDYLNFNGGLNNLIKNGSSTINIGNDVPVDVGAPVDGRVTSGNIGLNYMIEPDDNNRLTMNYIGSNMNKIVKESASEHHFLPHSIFSKKSLSDSRADNYTNNGVITWKHQSDSTHFMTISASGGIGNSQTKASVFSESLQNDIMENILDNRSKGKGIKFNSGLNANYIKRLPGKWKTIHIDMAANFSKKENLREWTNTLIYPALSDTALEEPYLDNTLVQSGITAGIRLSRPIGKGYYIEPSAGAAFDKHAFTRRQGLTGEKPAYIDSLSPGIYTDITSVRTGLHLRRNRPGLQMNVGLDMTLYDMGITFNNSRLANSRRYILPLPVAFFRKEIRSGRTFDISYNTNVNMPDANSLLPVTDYSNPLILTKGNLDLKPEYKNSIRATYFLFDQFTMSSFTAALNSTYTMNSFGTSSNISENLIQEVSAINTPYMMHTSINLNFSRPLYKAGIQFRVGITELWRTAFSTINAVKNRNQSLEHQLSIDLNNIRSHKWDVRVGAEMQVSDVRYSINKEMNNVYSNYSGKGAIIYRPHPTWSILLDADIRTYASRSFGTSVTVPLLGAEVTRYLLKNQRGSISLKAFDLLDKNRNINRSSHFNTLSEVRTNTIGRYIMLTLAYRLNKTGRAPSEITIH